MTNFTKRLTDNWQDGLSLILGVWLGLARAIEMLAVADPARARTLAAEVAAGRFRDIGA